jgi:hypothetical protein
MWPVCRQNPTRGVSLLMLQTTSKLPPALYPPRSLTCARATFVVLSIQEFYSLSICRFNPIYRWSTVAQQSRAAKPHHSFEVSGCQSFDSTLLWQQYQYRPYRSLCPACQVDEFPSPAIPMPLIRPIEDWLLLHRSRSGPMLRYNAKKAMDSHRQLRSKC